MTVDYDDPCSILASLKPALYALLRGEGVQTVEFEAGNGTRERVSYARSDIGMLRSEISRLEDACAVKQGKKRRRFAIRAVGRSY